MEYWDIKEGLLLKGIQMWEIMWLKLLMILVLDVMLLFKIHIGGLKLYFIAYDEKKGEIICGKVYKPCVE